MADNPYLSLATPVASTEDAATIAVESGGRQFDKQGNPLTSKTGARGAAQIQPTTAPEAAKLANVEYNPYSLEFDKEYNKKLGSAYLAKKIEEHGGDVEKGHAAYNAGTGGVHKAEARAKKEGGSWKDYLPAETRDYLTKITKAKETPKVTQQDNPYLHLASKKAVGDENSALEVGAKSAAKSAVTGIGSLPLMGLGAEVGGVLGAPAGPVGVAIGSVVGGVAGMFGGSAIINAGIDAIPDKLKATIGFDKATIERGRQEHPEAAFTGDLLGMLPMFGPGALKPIEYAAGKTIGAGTQRAAMAGFGAGMEGVSQVQQGEFNPYHLLASAGFGATFAKPTKLAESVGTIFHGYTPTVDPTASAWTGKYKEWEPAEKSADGVPIFKGGVTDGQGNPMPFDAKGKPTLGRMHRNEDGSAKLIELDVAQINELFNEGSIGTHYPGTYSKFKTKEEFAQFVLAHEEAHTRSPQGPDELEADYERRINLLAKEHIDNNPIYAVPDTEVHPIPQGKEAMDQWSGDAWYSLGKGQEADNAIATLRSKASTEAGLTNEDRMAIERHFETSGKHPLDPRQMELANSYFAPELKEHGLIMRELMRRGVITQVEMDEYKAGGYFPRVLEPKKMGTFERLKEAMSGGDKGGLDVNVAKAPKSGMERSFFTLEKGGKRMVVQRKAGPEGTILQWNNGKPTTFIHGIEELKAGDKIGDWTVKNSQRGEVETHTPYQYQKDPQMVLYKALSEARATLRAHQMLDEVIKSPAFAEAHQVVKVGEPIKEGFRVPKHLDKLPQFAGMAFENRTADIIEDYAINRSPNALTTLSGMLIKNMMLNPIPHIFNEAWHLYNARGLTGWVTPAGIARFSKTAVPAIKHVLSMSPEYRQTLRDGGSLLSANVRNNAFQSGLFTKAAKEFMKTPEADSLAKSLALSPMRLYDAISKASNTAMWVVRDAMYMQLLDETMQYKGMDRRAAIKEVERHMPSYRITPRVGEKLLGASMSRSLSETLQNPNVTVFSRYHFGLVKSLIETGKDVAAIRKGKEGLADFGHGVDSLAAIAVAISVLYPLQDMIAQQLSGNKDATQRRAGPYHIFHAIDGVVKNEKDPMAAMSSIFTFNPALLTGAQLIADRKLYSGQPVYHPEDSAEKIAFDVVKYLGGQVPIVGDEMKIQADPASGKRAWLAKQLDIQSPSQQAAIASKKEAHKKTVAGLHRSAKWKNQ